MTQAPRLERIVCTRGTFVGPLHDARLGPNVGMISARADDMDSERFLERVERWSGITKRHEAERAIGAAMAGLREALTDDARAALVSELPERFAELLRDGPGGTLSSLDELYRSAARHEHVRVGVAMEHVQTVCQALASLLPAEAMARLASAAPEFSDLFVVPDRVSSPPIVSHHRPILAEGRAGSRHPVSEARPGSEHPLSEAGPRGASGPRSSED